ncbi:MAG: NfeD family protein [Clostridium sp.]|uniref:NfeD family protein n=1 Tax=Clostridium sp. TaxID=1506 RepID=UPI003D6D565B
MELISFLSNISGIAIMCFAFGFIFVIIEMFHPGFGIPGIIGAILLVVGVVLASNSVMEVLVLLGIIIAILGVMLNFVLKSVTKGRLSKILILHETQKKEDGYIGTEDLEYFVGQEGVTITILRPSGIAEINGIKMDVVSEGAFITENTKVKIIKVEGPRIVVRVLTETKSNH